MSKTLIIGGVAGGATAAARLRRIDETREIVILERGGYISYANCGLPYFIGEVIKQKSVLLLQTKETMKNKYNIDVKLRHEAIKINRNKKTVTVRDHMGEEYEESYDDLILSTGSSPFVPPIPGKDLEGIYTLWNVDDMDRIKAEIDEKKPKRAVVIGGGFIGLEMVENLAERKLKVSLVEGMNQVMGPIDFELAQMVHENLIDHDVDLYLEEFVDSFEKSDSGIIVKMKSGKTLEADFVLLSIGVRPNSELAKDAGLKLNKRGGVQVDDYLLTSDPNIWAAGDIIEVKNFITKEPTMIPLAGPANKQGRIVANNIIAREKHKELEPYEGSMGTAVAKVFDYTVASVGLNEKNLIAKGMKKDEDYFVALISAKSHAGYYPMACTLVLKVLFDREGKIFGAQGIGQEGVDKRIDVIATAIRLGANVLDLKKLELAYAPPYSSPKDPVNMLGFVSENILNKIVKFVSPEEVIERKNDPNFFLLDVTEDLERKMFTIEDSYHIPLGQVRRRISELPKDKEICAFCIVGVRSYNAARILMQSGFENVSVVEGGTFLYKSFTFDSKKALAAKTDDNAPAGSGVADKPEEKVETPRVDESKTVSVDCSGLQCPGPIMKVNEYLGKMEPGQFLRVSATDMGFSKDVKSWCERTGNSFISTEKDGKTHIVTLQKGKDSVAMGCNVAEKRAAAELPQGKTMIVFDGDFDKALAAFIIANGAASMGRPVTMFFTFWGLNILRKDAHVPVKKNFMEKMFGKMMPRGTKNLKLSRMNMMGMGTAMMRKVMKDKNVSSLEDLMKSAMDNGVKIVACTMSMDVMGIQKEELIDGIEYAGVASYLGDAEKSNVNLFI